MDSVETPIRVSDGKTTYVIYRQDEQYGVDRHTFNRLFDYCKYIENKLAEAKDRIRKLEEQLDNLHSYMQEN